MRDFFKNLSSVYWWISVVVVGVVINVASAYLKTRLDTRLSKLSVWWRNKSEAQKGRRDEEVKKLRDDKQYQIIVGFREMRHRLRSIGLLIFGVLFFGMVTIFNDMTRRIPASFGSAPSIFKMVILAIAALAVLLATREQQNAIKAKLILFEALSPKPVLGDGTSAAEQIVEPERGSRVS